MQCRRRETGPSALLCFLTDGVQWCKPLCLLKVSTLVIKFHICVCRSCSQNKGMLGILQDCSLPYFHGQMKCHNEISCSNNPSVFERKHACFLSHLKEKTPKASHFKFKGSQSKKCGKKLWGGGEKVLHGDCCDLISKLRLTRN